MSEMVERVARALYAIRMEVAEGAGLHEPYTWETDNNAYREHCLREARAAIGAMREPTEAMKAAGFVNSPHDAGGCRDQIASDDEWMEAAVLAPWQAMLDAALAENK